MYDVEHQDEAIRLLHVERSKVVAMAKVIKDMKVREDMKNRRCALDVAGRILNRDVNSQSSTYAMEELAHLAIILASRLEAWLNKEADTQDEGVEK